MLLYGWLKKDSERVMAKVVLPLLRPSCECACLCCNNIDELQRNCYSHAMYTVIYDMVDTLKWC